MTLKDESELIFVYRVAPYKKITTKRSDSLFILVGLLQHAMIWVIICECNYITYKGKQGT